MKGEPTQTTTRTRPYTCVQAALVIVDFQNEWTDKNADDYLGNLSKLIKKTNKLIDACRSKNYKIIFTRHVAGAEGPFAQNSEGIKIISKLHKEKYDSLVTKHKVSPFYQSSLEKELKGIDEITVAGILTNMCVRSLIQDAYDRDFKITVVKDCCITYSNEVQKFTFKDLKETRPEIK
ncbi:MAG: cysteine hydrolase, partial [Candidatus Aenigmarchaeota archaeon]|nr:cysteine hydrolase [Candidatus Aenigmarchaeota archaeon]